MQHVLTVNVLMALALLTNLTTQVGVHDIGTLVRADTEKVQGVETQSREESAELRRQEIEAKRLEVEQKNAAKRAAITEKLSGRRAEQCEAKQEQINQMLDNRSEAARSHYETFTAIHDRLQAYTEEHDVEIKYDNALQIILPSAQDKALIAVQELENSQFSCAEADAAAPGAIIKEQVSATKQALSEYRDAIREYAEAIKNATGVTTEPAGEEQGGTNE